MIKMIRWTQLISLVLLVFGFIMFSSAAFSQNSGFDCGNGLVQQFVRGNTGRVMLDAPDLQILDEPNGVPYGSVPRGITFIVIFGPECSDDVSWYYIETDTGDSGWIEEGTQSYVLELYPPGVASSSPQPADAYAVENRNIDCSNTPVSAFHLGQVVQLTSQIADTPIYYGHPSIALFEFNSEYYFVSEKGWLVSGPHCFNGEWIWQWGRVDPYIGDEYTNTYLGSHPYVDPYESVLWIPERDGVQVLFEQVGGEVAQEAAYTPSRTRLMPPDRAPLTDVLGQIAFVGGGGGSSAVPGWYTDCSFSAVEFFADACLSLYPFQIGDNVEIEVFSPDGTLVERHTQTATLERATVYVDEWPMSQSEMYYTFGAVNIQLPTDWGLPQGIWRVEARNQNSMVTQVYRLVSDVSEVVNNPYIITRCESSTPILVAGDFPLDYPIDLVLIEPVTSNDEGITFRETARWTLQTDSHGELLIELGYLPPVGYFVVTKDEGDWSREVATLFDPEYNEIRASYGHTGLTTKATQWACITSEDRETARLTPIAYNSVSTGEFTDRQERVNAPRYFSFQGSAGDVVTLQLMSLETELGMLYNEFVPFDVSLQLESPSGVVVAKNDNAEIPLRYQTDSAIVNFTLPEDGLYIITADVDQEYDDRLGGFMLLLHGPNES